MEAFDVRKYDDKREDKIIEIFRVSGPRRIPKLERVVFWDEIAREVVDSVNAEDLL